MANDDHIAQLKKGVDAWNAWREQNPDIHPDLSHVDLFMAHLAHADLSNANLEEAKLGMADSAGQTSVARTFPRRTPSG
jgi:uncharacterized protein YjbI with pentapeptide repeats